MGTVRLTQGSGKRCIGIHTSVLCTFSKERKKERGKVFRLKSQYLVVFHYKASERRVRMLIKSLSRSLQKRPLVEGAIKERGNTPLPWNVIRNRDINFVTAGWEAAWHRQTVRENVMIPGPSISRESRGDSKRLETNWRRGRERELCSPRRQKGFIERATAWTREGGRTCGRNSERSARCEIGGSSRGVVVVHARYRSTALLLSKPTGLGYRLQRGESGIKLLAATRWFRDEKRSRWLIIRGGVGKQVYVTRSWNAFCVREIIITDNNNNNNNSNIR